MKGNLCAHYSLDGSVQNRGRIWLPRTAGLATPILSPLSGFGGFTLGLSDFGLELFTVRHGCC
jgi:hypothetical protein